MMHIRFKFIPILLISLSPFISLTNCLKFSVSPRIVGGDNVNEPIPYQISFQIMFGNIWRHICAGSIISPDFVITAAHCVSGKDRSNISILAGVTNLKSSSGSRHFVQEYVMHEEFAPKSKCDIALVKVTPPFQLNGLTIDAISFNDTTPVDGGISTILTGWGSMNQTGRGPYPNDLQVLTTNTLSNTDCQKYFPQLKSTEICTINSVLKGACNGDSGGPLVSNDKTKLIGILAFGSTICANGYPSIFTRVSEFFEWIQAKMTLP